MNDTRKKWLGLAFWMALSFGAAAFGGQFGAREWYQALNKPSWTPPGFLFGPVWTALYIMMGLAAWLVWKPSGTRRAKLALGIYVAQLALNALWSWLFFGLQRPDWAFFEIVALWVMILTTIILFWRLNRTAALLLAPYLMWVTFASALNFAIWQLNN